jgi:hypothetical protein
MTWCIDIPKADTPANVLMEGITEVWSIIKEADDKMIVYPWKARNFSRFKALSGPSKLQNNTKEFINRAQKQTAPKLPFGKTPFFSKTWWKSDGFSAPPRVCPQNISRRSC